MIWYFDWDKLLWIGAVYKAADWSIQKKEMTEQDYEDIKKGANIEFENNKVKIIKGDKYKNTTITDDALRVLEIEKEIRSLWASETTSLFLQQANQARVAQLREEKLVLENKLDKDTKDLDPSVLDTLINAIYG